MPDLVVLAPVTGRLVLLEDVPDPVFAAAMLGAGVAIEPVLDGDRQVVLAPVTGVVAALHPHAFAVRADDVGPDDPEHAVLVHLGIDTVQLGGAGFEVHVEQGDRVEAEQPVVTWDPAAVVAGGRSPLVPVAALGATAPAILVLAGVSVGAGSQLLRWT